MSETPGSADLLVQQRGPVLWLTITREERRNAMSHAVLAGMGQAIAAAQSQRELRAIVITGAGSKAFCAGADLQSAQAFPSRSATWPGCSGARGPAMCRWSRASTAPAWPAAWGCSPCATWPWPPAMRCSACPK